MDRRRFVEALGLAMLSPDVLAQPGSKVARVARLSAGASQAEISHRSALVEGLRALGWIEGKNLLIEERFAETRTEDLPRFVDDLVRSTPDVIVCSGPAPALAMKNARTQIPVVFVAVADPIGLGLGASLARPEGNFTGLSTIVPEGFLTKQLELLRETVPRASRVAFLTNPTNPIHNVGRDLRLNAARRNGFEVIEVQAKTREELEAAFAEAARQKAEAMYLSGDPLPMANRQVVAELALKHRLPVMFLFRQHVEAGGLMSYGTDVADLHRRAASYVDKILKGANPADLPIEQPTRFELAVNLKTAKSLGIRIPQSILLRADKVIE